MALLARREGVTAPELAAAFDAALGPGAGKLSTARQALRKAGPARGRQAAVVGRRQGELVYRLLDGA